MEAKQIVIPASILGVVVGLYLYLKGGDSGADTQVSYPNSAAGGLPQYQSPGIAYNFGTRSPAPSPMLTLGPPPPIPPTPNYQKYNYAPLNFFNLSPQAAAKATIPKPDSAAAKAGKGGDSCCCDDCGCDGNHPKFRDANSNTEVVANAGEQARATPPQLLGNLAQNLSTSVMTDPFVVMAMLWNWTSGDPGEVMQ